jgi:hypothetical protein
MRKHSTVGFPCKGFAPNASQWTKTPLGPYSRPSAASICGSARTLSPFQALRFDARSRSDQQSNHFALAAVISGEWVAPAMDRPEQRLAAEDTSRRCEKGRGPSAGPMKRGAYKQTTRSARKWLGPQEKPCPSPSRVHFIAGGWSRPHYGSGDRSTLEYRPSRGIRNAPKGFYSRHTVAEVTVLN